MLMYTKVYITGPKPSFSHKRLYKHLTAYHLPCDKYNLNFNRFFLSIRHWDCYRVQHVAQGTQRTGACWLSINNRYVLLFSGAKPTTVTPKAPAQKKQESSSSEESSSDSEDEAPAKVWSHSSIIHHQLGGSWIVALLRHYFVKILIPPCSL